MADQISPNHEGLFSLATGQAGFFRADQAQGYGFTPDRLSYHAKTGRFRRVRRGLYRIRDFPWTPDEEVVAAWVAVGRDDAFVSHTTALVWHDLSDLIVDRIDITIPRSLRYLSLSDIGVRLHTTSRWPGPMETQRSRGIRVSSPERAIVESAAVHVAPDQIVQAVIDALDRSVTTPSHLVTCALPFGRRVTTHIKRAIATYEELPNTRRLS